MFGFTFGQMGAPGILSALSSAIKSLFVGGTQGAWYRTSQAITAPWYQDSAGTTPVTEVEQPVGFALDRSLGGTVGPELVSNGTFNTDINGWSASNANGTLSFLSNKLRVTATATFDAGAKTTTVVSPNKMLAFSFDITTSKANLFFSVISLGGEIAFLGPLAAGTTRISRIGLSGGSGSDFVIRFSQAVEAVGDWFEVDNVSVKLLDGNHATQPTAASRPVLSSRVNLLLKTERIGDGEWSKIAVTIGSNTADENGNLTLIPVSNTPGVGSYIAQNVQIPNNCVVVRTVTAKKVTGANQIIFEFSDGVTGGNAVFDLISGSASATAGVASTVNLGNGFWECTHAFTTAPTGTPNANVIYIGVYGSTATPTTIAIGKAQISLGSKQRYQRVGSVNLLTKTEDFTNAAWVGYYVKPLITSNVLAPDGTFTATQFEGADYSAQYPFSGVLMFGGPAANSGNVTVSVWARCVSGTLNIVLGIDDNYGASRTLTTTWQLISATFNITTATPNGRALQIFETDFSNPAWQIWHPQTELGAVATTYQKVDVPANNYDAAGFPKYLTFDGTQSSLSNATGGGGSAGFFFCAAIVVSGNAGLVRTLFSDHNGSTSGYTLRVEANNQVTLYAGNGAGYSSASGPIPLIGIKYVVTGYDDGVNLVIQLSGSPPTIVARPAVSAGLSNFSLGKAAGGEADFFKGQIYEAVYVRNSGLTPAQRLQVQQQIATAAGITL